MIVRRVVFLCATACVFLPIAGCSSDVRLCQVTGRVTKSGADQKGLLVQFSPMAGGRPATARTDEKGGYKLEYAANKMGAIVGRHRVAVISGGERDDEGGLSRETRLFTGEFEVKPGQNVFDIAIQ